MIIIIWIIIIVKLLSFGNICGLAESCGNYLTRTQKSPPSTIIESWKIHLKSGMNTFNLSQLLFVKKDSLIQIDQDILFYSGKIGQIIDAFSRFPDFMINYDNSLTRLANYKKFIFKSIIVHSYYVNNHITHKKFQLPGTYDVSVYFTDNPSISQTRRFSFITSNLFISKYSVW